MGKQIDFEKLQARIPEKDIKSRKQSYTDKKTGERKSFSIRYIDARDVMDRLDAACGPENWKTDFYEVHGGVVCVLSLRIDGEWVGKSDVGTPSNIEPEKGTYSDALKRAAVQWGIGRELYQEGGDGTANPTPAVEPTAESGDVPWEPTVKETRECVKWAKRFWEEAEGKELPWPHVRNRIALALGMPTLPNQTAETFDDCFYAFVMDQRLTKVDVIEAIQFYESDTTDQLGREDHAQA